MKRADAPRYLRTAARIVDAVIATLDRSEEKCDHCEVTKKKNWGEDKSAVELAAVVKKLHRNAAWLANPTPKK